MQERAACQPSLPEWNDCSSVELTARIVAMIDKQERLTAGLHAGPVSGMVC